VPGPSPDRRASAAWSRPGPLRRARQPPSSAPWPRPVSARAVRAVPTGGRVSRSAATPPSRRPRRSPPRIRTQHDHRPTSGTPRAPASRVADHRLVQADPALLDQAQHPPGGHRLGQRGGLKGGGGRHRLAGRGVGHTVAGRPDHLPAVDEGNGQAGRGRGGQRLPCRVLHGPEQAGPDGVAAPPSGHRPARPGNRCRLTGRNRSMRLVDGRRRRPGLARGR
jgi:hypothetical protein